MGFRKKRKKNVFQIKNSDEADLATSIQFTSTSYETVVRVSLGASRKQTERKGINDL